MVVNSIACKKSDQLPGVGLMQRKIFKRRLNGYVAHQFDQLFSR